MMKNVWIAISLLTLIACKQSESGVAVEAATITENKNLVVENILNRRSIRSYLPEQIKKEQLDTILNCAINAPSARNYQPWEVRVIQNPEILKQVNEGFNQYAQKNDLNNERLKQAGSIFYNAPTLIVIAKDKSNPYGGFDCGLLSQNIMLSAQSMHIGSVCLGYLSRYFLEEDAKELVAKFNIPETHEVLIVIGLGYPNESPEAQSRERSRVQFVK